MVLRKKQSADSEGQKMRCTPGLHVRQAAGRAGKAPRQGSAKGALAPMPRAPQARGQAAHQLQYPRLPQQAGTAEPFGAGQRIDSAKRMSKQNFIKKKAKLPKSALSISDATSRHLHSLVLYAETNSTGRVTLPRQASPSSSRAVRKTVLETP